MKIKGIVDEDFINYKKPCMFIISSICTFKCDKENGGNYCHNSSLINQETIDISDYDLVQRYLKNDIPQAICVAGLEPFDQFDELLSLLKMYRKYTFDPFIIYSGYYPDEIDKELQELKKYRNVIVKFGRYKPDNEKHFDEVLGVYLSSDNQYAVKIS